jgi:phenylalanyl-tRNA synthetase beta chain
MPVIQLSLTRLGAFCKGKATEAKILETLPYLGLDIEDHSGDLVSVEYSPNRPDFSSEAGIARSLVGLLDIVTGLPKYNFPRSKFKITVTGREIERVRPVIKGLYAELAVTNELIKQIITMQEDLHNGIGRKRSKVAIGIHNAAVIDQEIRYYGVTDENFRFVPLGSSKKQTVREILSSTDQGGAYGKLLSKVFPMLEDSKGNVLSMPPVINGDLTRLEPGISKLFVDITGTDDYAVDASVAIIASMLSDVGARVFQIQVFRQEGSDWVPDMTPRTMPFHLKLSNEILGLELDEANVKEALERSRCSLIEGSAIIPRFRSDIIHPIDLAEEVALGFGIWKMHPQVISTSLVGSLNPRLKKIDSIIEVLVGLGFTEVWNFSLSPRELVDHCSSEPLRVEDTKSQSFEFLRCDLTASLLQVLGGTSHEEYPQLIFEEGPTFSRSDKTTTGISEEEHLAALIADSEARYSQIRSKLDALFRLILRNGLSIQYEPAEAPGQLFAKGRSADVLLRKQNHLEKFGTIGEIAPAALERFGIAVPVIGFELNLERLLKD